MSIGKRFIDLARAELNSLLDYAARRDGGDDERGGDADGDGLAGFSRQELEEELARRRSAHAEVEEAMRGGRGPTTAEARAAAASRAGENVGGSRASGDRARARAGGSARAGGASGSDAAKVRQAYATLEVAQGAGFDTVRAAYRTLMRKYHPDHHTSSPAAQRDANEVAQKLTAAYKLLQKRLER